MKLNPYLSFDGRCREAFELYAKALNGKISFIQTIGESPMASNMPPEAHGRIMHVTLQIGDQVLQGADAPHGQFSTPSGFCVALHFDEVAEAQRVFDTLAQEGMVQMALQPTFWAKAFGMLIDQFGTPWIVNAGQMDLVNMFVPETADQWRKMEPASGSDVVTEGSFRESS